MLDFHLLRTHWMPGVSSNRSFNRHLVLHAPWLAGWCTWRASLLQLAAELCSDSVARGGSPCLWGSWGCHLQRCCKGRLCKLVAPVDLGAELRFRGVCDAVEMFPQWYNFILARTQQGCGGEGHTGDGYCEA
jgi:hypothetical protein